MRRAHARQQCRGLLHPHLCGRDMKPRPTEVPSDAFRSFRANNHMWLAVRGLLRRLAQCVDRHVDLLAQGGEVL